MTLVLVVFQKTSWYCFYYICIQNWTNSSVAQKLRKNIKTVRSWNDQVAAQKPRGPGEDFAAGFQIGTTRKSASESNCCQLLFGNHTTLCIWKAHFTTQTRESSISQQNQLAQSEGFSQWKHMVGEANLF